MYSSRLFKPPLQEHYQVAADTLNLTPLDLRLRWENDVCTRFMLLCL